MSRPPATESLSLSPLLHLDGSSARKRRSCRSFDAVDFGRTLCKRLRTTREAILHEVDQGKSASAVASRCAAALRLEWEKPYLDDMLGRRPASLLPASLPASRLSTALLRPLQPPTDSSPLRLPAPPDRRRRRGLIWDLTREQNDVPQMVSSSFLRERRLPTHRIDPMSYLEYSNWLQRAVPESACWQLDEEARETPSDNGDLFPRVSAADLLRHIAERKLQEPLPPTPPARAGPPPLTAKEGKLSSEGLDPDRNLDEVVARGKKVELTREKLLCLVPGEWLNDEVINFYFELLQTLRDKKSEKGGPRCWFTSSFFWGKLSGRDCKNYGYKDGMARWTRRAKIDVFALDYVIIPMNIGETHWAMGAIDFREKGFRYFDSMLSRPHSNFVPFLRRYLADEFKDKKKTGAMPDVENWDLLPHDHPVPQQRNGYDCGVFTCYFATYFTAGNALEFDQDDMMDLRLRLAARIQMTEGDWDPPG